jgi:peroxiredoxin
MKRTWQAVLIGAIALSSLSLALPAKPVAAQQSRTTGTTSRPATQSGVPIYAPSSKPTTQAPRPARQLSPLDQLRAGDFKLQALDGSAVKLGDLLGEGKPVLIQFWQTSCEQSQAEVAYLKDVWSRYHRQGLVMLALTIQDPAQRAYVNTFMRSTSINYPVYFAPPNLYRLMTGGALGTPQTYVFSRDGRIANRLIGWEPRRGQPALEGALKSVLD